MTSSEQSACPNYETCLLVNGSTIVTDPVKKDRYISLYCTGEEISWSKCKRYIVKIALNFCPDPVLPDSPGTPSDFIDEFDKDLNQTNESIED